MGHHERKDTIAGRMTAGVSPTQYIGSADRWRCPSSRWAGPSERRDRGACYNTCVVNKVPILEEKRWRRPHGHDLNLGDVIALQLGRRTCLA